MWYNFKTGENEERETPEDFTDYIPQDPSALALYKVCLQMGETPIQAVNSVMASVAKSVIGEGAPTDRSKTPYELIPVNTATCPRCDSNPLGLVPVGPGQAGILPAFLICTNCLYIGQVGVGPVPRTGD